MSTAAPATRATLEQLRAAMVLEVDERVARGMCGCGCPERLPVPVGRRRYVNERHRQRAYRARLEREAAALGVPTRLSHSALQATIRPHDRRADAQTARRTPQRRKSRPRPGVTVYVPTVDAVAALLDALADDARPVVVEHRAALAAALERRRRARQS